MRHILSVLLENEPGALSRVVGLFSQRNFNIESLTVAATDDITLSRITITTTGTDKLVEQVTKQLNKLVDVVKVVDLTEGDHIERELMMTKEELKEELARQETPEIIRRKRRGQPRPAVVRAALFDLPSDLPREALRRVDVHVRVS
ncbi:MAG: acetolactate synthase small subunit, partial [Pseudomonadales bacterium]|nr:acetolactate synthase small subunit [Pseudomonadales bacterium]